MKRKAGTLAVLISGILYGCTPILAKTVYADGSDAFSLAIARNAFAAVLFWSICLLRGVDMRVNRKEWKDIVWSTLAFGITPVLLLSSYNYTATGLATTVHFVYPVLVLLGCVIFYHAALDRTRVLCCVLCALGIILFYTPGDMGSFRGILIAFTSGVTYAFYTVYFSHSSLLKMEGTKAFAWIVLVTTILMIPVILFSGGFAMPHTLFGRGSLLVFCTSTSIAGSLYQFGTKNIGAESTALLSTLEPLTSVVIGLTVYHEILSVRTAVGIVSILASVCLLATQKEKSAPVSAQNAGGEDN